VDNLIGNALKFTPPGGRIDVRLRQNGDKFQLAVADTGVGMSPENIQHIFERFYQAEGLARWILENRAWDWG
jgi:signal transduction histidine kinase